MRKNLVCVALHTIMFASPLDHGTISPTVSGSCGKDTLSPTLGDGSKCCHRQGFKTVCIAPTCTTVCIMVVSLCDKLIFLYHEVIRMMNDKNQYSRTSKV